MNPHLTLIIATERQRDLERAAGCCTPLAEHRRAVRRPVRNRARSRLESRRPAVSEPSVCCA
jgi:hypothetical protein